MHVFQNVVILYCILFNVRVPLLNNRLFNDKFKRPIILYSSKYTSMIINAPCSRHPCDRITIIDIVYEYIYNNTNLQYIISLRPDLKSSRERDGLFFRSFAIRLQYWANGRQS